MMTNVMAARIVAVPFACCVLAGPAHAQTSFPMLTHAHPVAVQRGKTTEVVVDAKMNLAGAYKALFEGAGISAEIAPAAGTTVASVKMKVTVAAEAQPGVREFR